ncbi:MAG TPA: phosphopantetheine-binding protein, partial [Steroidobacteraceae bacterium]|nr:phosphopantetheine-binding protein [Steroidobacteraceae bacterium]
GEVEQALARIWQEVLKVERVGRHDNFFELGGHSLLAVQMVSRVRAVLGVDLALHDVFAMATIESLGARAIHIQLTQFDPDDLVQLLGTVRTRDEVVVATSKK